MLRSLATEKGGYIVAVMDCCREILQGRGIVQAAQVVDKDEDTEDYSNLVIWFGCPPGLKVNADSTIAAEFF